MKAQRRGSDLRTMIRVALAALKRDPNEIDTKRMSVTEMETLHRDLYEEWKHSKVG